MKIPFLCLLAAAMLFSTNAVRGAIWEVHAPSHPQTFSYGSERRHQWTLVGKHLGIYMEFTNDPYVDRTEPRQYDSFLFEFPEVRLGADGRTFYYRSTAGRTIAVATRDAGGLFDTVSLLPSSRLEVKKVHGVLSLSLLVSDDRALAANTP